MDLFGTFCSSVPLVTLAADERFIDKAPIQLFTIEDQGCNLHSGRVWIGHDKDSLLEGNVQVYARSRVGDRVTCLGEVYLHKHTGAYAANDYFDLTHLAKISPMWLDVGDLIWCQRDVHNVGKSKCNCFDLEIRLNVSWNLGWFW